jgi:hypothetical protein
MDEFIPWSRQAFRSLHGLPSFGEDIHLSAEVPGRLLVWARRHRIIGLLQAGRPNLAAGFQSVAYGDAQYSARCTREAERLFERLAPALPTLALVKGPALAAQAWSEPGLRIFDDLDYLCAQEDLPRLEQEMQQAGYAPEIEDPRQRALLWLHGWGLTFHHSGKFMVEVNHRFLPRHYPWPRRLDGQRTELFVEQKLDGACVRAPLPALHLLLCCSHAVWHGWTRLAWLVDIAGLLVRHPDSFRQAKAWTEGCPFSRRTLEAGCGVAEALFGPGLTPTTLPPVEKSVLDEAIAILNGTTSILRGRELRHFHERFMNPAEKAAYRLRRITIPGARDFKWVRLPLKLRGLYWIFRPIRAVLSGKSGD